MDKDHDDQEPGGAMPFDTGDESQGAGSPASSLKDRGFILLRFTLIIATSCLLLVEIQPTEIPPTLLLLMVAALLSNIALLALPAPRLRSPLVIGAAILGDTAWITAALIATGRFNADFFYVYFFVLFLAGIGENIRLIVLSVLVVCSAYVVLIIRTAGPDQILTSQALIRIPFLFSVAIFYGYLVNRLRGERHRAEKERAIINHLEDNRRVLAESNKSLQEEIEGRERVEKELRKFSRAVEQSSNLVMIVDDDEKVEFVNPPFESISGAPAEEVIGRGLDVFKEMGAPANIIDQMVSAVRNRTEWRGEIPLKQNRGPEMWLSTSTSPIRSAEGEVINTLVIATDISERVLIERRLTDANAEMHRLSQMKSNFVSTVSHELKSPLTAIKNAVSLIDPGGKGESNEKFLQMIKRSANRLNFIISDLLDMSKVESGKLTIAAEPVAICSFLSEIVEPLESQAAAASVELVVDAPDNLPEVLADAKRIEQVVTNLISNALKATPKGGTITVSAEQGDEIVTIGVRDTGIGLSVDDQKSVFDAFFQADNVLRNKSGGTGLGLTICRDLVRGHGSDLHLESELGEGSCFSFHLPVASERAKETIAFENDVRTKFRAHPYFTVLLIDFGADQAIPDGALTGYVFETLHNVLHHLVPRSLDIFCDQPAHRRIIVVLLSTPREGGRVVKQRLTTTLATNLFKVGGRGMASLEIHGPAAYPEDADFGAGLIECAILESEDTEDEQ
jgi:PAS domain S-box-containing protein